MVAFHVPRFACLCDLPAKEFLVKKTLSLFAFLPLFTLTLAVTGCGSDSETDGVTPAPVAVTPEEKAEQAEWEKE